jgi:predicted dehydrogenase
MSSRPRAGLIGTGVWARTAHAPALAASDRVEFAGVWGRDPRAAAELAHLHGTVAMTDAETLIDAVDIVVFAVPPAVQLPLALRAAAAGRRLLLEKPTAFTASEADALADAVERGGGSAVVMFTDLLDPPVGEWARDAARDGAWLLEARRLARTLVDPDDPFGASPWRHERGLLWDVGPHQVALALRVLGPVEEVLGTRGPGDLTIVVTRHRDGGRAQLALRGDAPVTGGGTTVVTASGSSAPPDTPWEQRIATSTARALAGLADAVEGRPIDPDLPDARFGAEVVHVLEAAEHSAGHGGAMRVKHPPV